jgi:adenylate cyclase
MPVEIERKFLVRGDAWRGAGVGQRIRQGYLSREDGTTVRVRRAGTRACITIKGAADGPARPEYEYEIPCDHAEEMLQGLCHKPLIEKTRYRVDHGGATWQVDEFAGDNDGLVLAEIELRDAAQSFDLPDWVGAEVTDDRRYRNASLARHPVRLWPRAPKQTLY